MIRDEPPQSATGTWGIAPREVCLRLRVAITLHGDLRGCSVDVPKIVGRKLDRCRSDILVEAVEFGSAGDRDDLRLLGQQPGERDLRGCRALLIAYLLQQ